MPRHTVVLGAAAFCALWGGGSAFQVCGAAYASTDPNCSGYLLNPVACTENEMCVSMSGASGEIECATNDVASTWTYTGTFRSRQAVCSHALEPLSLSLSDG